MHINTHGIVNRTRPQTTHKLYSKAIYDVSLYQQHIVPSIYVPIGTRLNYSYREINNWITRWLFYGNWYIHSELFFSLNSIECHNKQICLLRGHINTYPLGMCMGVSIYNTVPDFIRFTYYDRIYTLIR